MIYPEIIIKACLLIQIISVSMAIHEIRKILKNGPKKTDL